MDEDSHGKFKVFYHQVHKIQIFLTKIMDFFGKEMSSEEIILNLFKATNIETLAFAEIKAVATLFEVKAKSQTSTLAFAQQKVKVSKHLNRLYAYKHMLEKYEVELIKENQNKDQNKNRTPLYATAMCLIAIGEIATGLIMIRKDEKKFDVSIKDVLSKHSKLLGDLSGISTYLTHETQSLPTFPSLVKVCKNVLQDVSSLENLLEVINSLNQTILPEQQVHRLGEPFEQEHEELAKESPNVVRSTTIAPSSSLIISSSQQNKKDQSEKNVKRKEPATPSSEEDDPNAKRPKFSI